MCLRSSHQPSPSVSAVYSLWEWANNQTIQGRSAFTNGPDHCQSAKAGNLLHQHHVCGQSPERGSGASG